MTVSHSSSGNADDDVLLRLVDAHVVGFATLEELDADSSSLTSPFCFVFRKCTEEDWKDLASRSFVREAADSRRRDWKSRDADLMPGCCVEKCCRLEKV